MDNYKIKVKDEQNFKEVASLINTLGYGINFSYSNASGEVVKGLFLKSNGIVEWTHRDTYFDLNDSKELTLPQLRDLVVLKRNDVKDATHTDGNRKAFLDSAGKYHYWCFHKNEWIDSKHIAYLIQYLKPIQTAQAVLNDLDELREEYKDYHKDPALISGAEAKIAWANGKEIEYQNKLDSDAWIVIDDTNTLGVFSKDQFVFRLKPQTIKLELELPKPFEPKVNDLYCCIAMTNLRGYTQKVYKDDGDDECLIHLGAYRIEEEIKQVVEQLRKIRGTNS
ncbi:hypothetical protein [Acinetobacter pittii]|uniref:hypothetical protein n=1 Tax=Acinetobacter pittii TaxID=48296 RepID=UPI00119DAB09|nr:hypothetical protein [Acinetobacter pittii]